MLKQTKIWKQKAEIKNQNNENRKKIGFYFILLESQSGFILWSLFLKPQWSMQLFVFYTLILNRCLESSI